MAGKQGVWVLRHDHKHIGQPIDDAK